MNTVLYLLLTHLAATGLGLAIFRRWFGPRPFRHPSSVGAALREPAFRALLLLVIVGPYAVAQLIGHLALGIDYAAGRYAWTLALHTGPAVWYYLAQLQAAPRSNSL